MKLFEFLDNLDTAEKITSDADDTYKVGMWTAHKNELSADFEGQDYQNPRIAIMYDGTQGQNGWFWEVIEGKDVVGSSDTVFKTADDAREDAEYWIDEMYEPEEPEGLADRDDGYTSNIDEGITPAKKKQLSKLLAQQKELRAKKAQATGGRRKQVNAKLKALGAKISALRAMKKGSGEIQKKAEPKSQAPDTDKNKEAETKRKYDVAAKKQRSAMQAIHKNIDRAGKQAGLDMGKGELGRGMEKLGGITKGFRKNLERQEAREKRAAERKKRGLKGRAGRSMSVKEQIEKYLEEMTTNIAARTSGAMNKPSYVSGSPAEKKAKLDAFKKQREAWNKK